ncbi:MAG: pirin family protein [Parvibaculum sp.]|nr:pirin family protein [Parvibaculum sp.]
MNTVQNSPKKVQASAKKVLGILSNPHRHWVGDGFPVRSLFSYGADSEQVSPFLLLDHAGPHVFEPALKPRGVGTHPHRGFETVTIVYEGEVAHRDSVGNGGVIGPGDVQWMTAAGGILHEEFHSQGYTKSGGPFHMVQLWVNLPAKDKMNAPSYQAIVNSDIPSVDYAGGKARVRVIAGQFEGHAGPAHTHTPINVWDTSLQADAKLSFDLPEGHTSLLVVLKGRITVNGTQDAGASEIVSLSREGGTVEIEAAGDTVLLILTGEPIDEPVVGYGPFVMNTETQIHQAIADFNAGRFGAMEETVNA